VAALVPFLADAGVDLIVSSPEQKAVITGNILAQGLGVRLVEAADLAEQGWSRVPYFPAQDDFVAAVRQHFARPDDVVFGGEASRAAAARFDAVVRETMAMPDPPQLPAFVSHGRIMSAWMEKMNLTRAFDFWQGLRMPDAHRIDLAEAQYARIPPW
jgi:broad specificity phosphatase PhoE